jgi:putative ABC transport system permease protein
MIYNYLNIAWRNIVRHKLFSFINIFGLASGMTVCMLAMIKIKDAYDFDNFHPNSDRTYRIITDLKRKNQEHFLYASSPRPLAGYLKSNYDVVDKSTAVSFRNDEVTANNKKLAVKEAYVDPDFYRIFGFKVISGMPATRPQTALLTAETAEKFFGKHDPAGKIVTIDSKDFLITGILAKPPSSSHLRFDLLASAAMIPSLKEKNINEDWADENAAYTYIQLKAGVSEQDLQNVLKSVSKQANTVLIPSVGKNFVFDAQPLGRISPGNLPMHNLTAEPILPNLIAFALIGLSILLLAFFNYVNLTLASSLDRAREIGIRKVAGAVRYDLVLQFLTESVLAAIFAFSLAYIQLRAISMLPTVQNIIGEASQDKTLWIYFILFTIISGLIAGWIPARVLSGFQPVRVLKGKFNASLFGGIGLRKTLIVIQFSASLIAIVILVVFYRQSVFMATADYGFENDRILNIELPEHSYEKAAAAFAAVPGIESVSGTSGLFGISREKTEFMKPGKISDSVNVAYFSVTPSFVSNIHLRMVAGENLPTASSGSPIRDVLLNEEACRELYFKDPSNVIGKFIWANDSIKYIVKGVVKDFHYANFLRPIQPLLLVNKPDEFKILNLKVTAGTTETMLASVEKTWKKLYPDQPLRAGWFHRQLYDHNIHSDDLMFIALLTIMALSIACLGLLGMVIYTTKNRSKEVSIRRVIGAGLWQLIVVISREFVALLVLSVCIGLPIGFLAGREFLQQYAYRIPVSFNILAGSAAALLFFGGITIGWQTYRSALNSPLKNLRTE